MSLLKQLLRTGSRFQEIEFTFLLAWALLFPAKQSYLYYLGFAALLVFFCLKKIFVLRNISSMRFSVFLLLFNLLIFVNAVFSRHPGRSLLFAADVLLLSLWFFLFDIEKTDVIRYLRLLALVISLSSLVHVVFFAFQTGSGPVTPVFRNPILQGIAAALAVLFFLHVLLEKFAYPEAALLLLNGTSLIVSASKAAFLTMALLAAVMIVSRRRQWLKYFFVVLLSLLLLPNPLRRMTVHSLQKDPYVLNRLDIWNMSARMFRVHPWLGVGPDLFAEAAGRFNFPQANGPARYFKLPESPHSDYWKIITENGLTGLLFVVLFLFFTIRRLLAPPWLDLPKVLLAFLVLQMFFFNFIFNGFFLLVFLFLLYSFYWRRLQYVSLTAVLKFVYAGLLALIFLLLYLLPFHADRLLQDAAAEKNIVRRFSLLNGAALCAPFDERVPLARAGVLREFFRVANNLEAWEDAWKNVRQAQKLSAWHSEAQVFEAELFELFLEKKLIYRALAEEILAPLRRAEKLDPFNPFIKQHQAVILSKFDRRVEARQKVLAALALEPDYVEAIFFLHELDGAGVIGAAMQERLAQIQTKAQALNVKPGSYLFKLFRSPEKKAAIQ